jgi:hypothetical protein
VTEPWWRVLLRQQQSSGFADLAGGHATLTLPVTDRLVTRIVASRMPRSLPLREVVLEAGANNAFLVRLRLIKPSFLPPFTLRLAIARQPQLPQAPVLVLQNMSAGIAALAAPLARLFDALPPWIRLEADHIAVDLRVLLQQQGMADVLGYLTDLQLTTEPGVFVVHVRAEVPSAASGG